MKWMTGKIIRILMNIQRLIRNLYGDKYGVLFQSEIGKGTIVTVCLPMRKDRTV